MADGACFWRHAYGGDVPAEPFPVIRKRRSFCQPAGHHGDVSLGTGEKTRPENTANWIARAETCAGAPAVWRSPGWYDGDPCVLSTRHLVTRAWSDHELGHAFPHVVVFESWDMA